MAVVVSHFKIPLCCLRYHRRDAMPLHPSLLVCLKHGSSYLQHEQLCYADVPHIRKCSSCDRCLVTELPSVRFDFSTWGTAYPLLPSSQTPSATAQRRLQQQGDIQGWDVSYLAPADLPLPQEGSKLLDGVDAGTSRRHWEWGQLPWKRRRLQHGAQEVGVSCCHVGSLVCQHHMCAS